MEFLPSHWPFYLRKSEYLNSPYLYFEYLCPPEGCSVAILSGIPLEHQDSKQPSESGEPIYRKVRISSRYIPGLISAITSPEEHRMCAYYVP